MKRLTAFCLMLAIATVQGAPAFALSKDRVVQCYAAGGTDADVDACLKGFEREARAVACAAEVIPGQQELMTKLGGGTVMQNGRLVYYPPTFVQLNNEAYATPYDSGVAAAIVRHVTSCDPDIAKAEPLATQLQAMQAFANGLFTYGMLSMINARFLQVSVDQLNASR